MSHSAIPDRVRRRRVLYVPGFDPRPPSAYYRIFREEAAKHAQMTGEPITVGPKRKTSNRVETWTVVTGPDDDRVETQYEFLRWDDIVRANWVRSVRSQWLQTISSGWTTIRDGLWKATLQSSYPFAVTMMLPMAAVLGRFLLVAIAAAVILWALPAVSGWPWWVGIPVVAGLGYWVHRKAQDIETKWNIPWIGQIVIFTVRDAASEVADVEDRRAEFAELLIAATRDASADEVLLIGHSHGAAMAISTLARALEKEPRLGQGRAVLSLLTLGSTSISLGRLTKAEWFRRDLRRVGAEPSISWTDFSAPPDGACYALVDPVRLCNPDFARPAGMPPSPKLLNARILDLIDPETYNAIRRDRMRMHFQYLLVGDRLGEYDYFRIVGGPLTLADRYKDRPSVENFTRLRLFAR